jgi:hypothetical protein
MTRCCSVFLAVLSGLVIGCDHPAVKSQAPGGRQPLAAHVDSEGDYGLYRVTKRNDFGQPLDAKLIVTYHLQKGDPIGFQWVTDKATINEPNAHVDLEAYAADHHDALGPITLTTEKYYWADVNGWDAYWRHAPVVGFFRVVTLQ